MNVVLLMPNHGLLRLATFTDVRVDWKKSRDTKTTTWYQFVICVGRYRFPICGPLDYLV